MVRRPHNRGKGKGSPPGQSSDQESDLNKTNPGEDSDVKGSEKRPVATLDLTAEDKSPADDKKFLSSSKDPIKTIISESGIKPDEKSAASTDAGDKMGEKSTKTESPLNDLSEKKSQSKDTSSDDHDDDDDFSGASDITAEQIAMVMASQRSSGSFFKLLFAGLIGAVLALAGQQFMPRLVTGTDVTGGDVAITDASGATEALNAQISALEKRVEEFTKQASNVDVENRLDELSKKVASVQDEDFTSRLANLEQTIKDVSLIAKGGEEQIAGVAALASKVNSLESRVQDDIEAVKTEFSNKLRSDMEQLSKAVAEQESLAQIEGVKLKASTLGKKLAELDAQTKKLDGDFSQINSDVSSLKAGAVNKSTLEEELLPLRSSLDAVNKKIELAAERETEALEAARQSALAIAFSNLKRTMDRGEGFVSELNAVKKLSSSEVDFTILSSFGQSGIPTEQSLLKAYPKLAINALSKTNEDNATSGWDRVVTKARTAFQYRRTGDVEGETMEAILARMEHKFKSGQVEDVLVEAKSLTGKAQLTMAPWLKKLEGRLQVETAMHKLEDQLLSSLSPR